MFPLHHQISQRRRNLVSKAQDATRSSASLRTTYQCTVRGIRASRRGSFLLQPPSYLNSHPISLRHLSSTTCRPRYQPHRPGHASGAPGNTTLLQSSMFVRRGAAALVSALVGYGAWYSYQGTGNDTSAAISRALLLRTGLGQRHPRATGADHRRGRASHRHLRGEGPIEKTTEDGRRKVLEMLTPEQATHKLRRSRAVVFCQPRTGCRALRLGAAAEQ